MKQNRQQRRTNISRLLMKIVLVLVSTALVVYFMPRGDEFGYKYELNKPWNYGLLIANTKFPVLKNDSVLQKEQEKAQRSFQPYYNYNRSVRDSMVNKLYKQAVQGANAHPYVHHVAGLLDSIYQRGVLSVEDYARLTDETQRRIRIVRGNVATSASLSSIYTLSSAYRYIMTVDTIKFPRYILQQYNIDELIQPNLTYDVMKSEEELEGRLQSISNYNGFVQAGQKIIDRGETVTDELYDILRSYEIDYEKRNIDEAKIPYKFIGQIIFVFINFVLMTIFLSLFRADYFEHVRNVALIYALPVVLCVIAAFMVSHKMLNVFMLPCCFVPIVIRVFMDSRTAFMVHCAMVMIISMILTTH